MKAARFADFLKTGSIHWLRLGVSRAAVLDGLGSPQYWTDKDHGQEMMTAWAYYYQELLVVFEDDSVQAFNISVSRSDEPCILSWEDGMVPIGTTIEAFNQFLRRHKITAAPPSKEEFGNMADAALVTGGGVLVYTLYDAEFAEPSGASGSSSRSSQPYVATFVCTRKKAEKVR